MEGTPVSHVSGQVLPSLQTPRGPLQLQLRNGWAVRKTVGWGGGEVGRRGEMSGVRALRAGGLGTAPTGPTAGAVEAVRPARDARAQRQRLHLRR